MLNLENEDFGRKVVENAYTNLQVRKPSILKVYKDILLFHDLCLQDFAVKVYGGKYI